MNQPKKSILLDNGESIAYLEMGNKGSLLSSLIGKGHRTLIMLHGILASSVQFHHFYPALSSQFMIMAPDIRGFGHSSYQTPIKSVDDLVEDLKNFIDKFKLEKVSLLGYSLGGGAALTFAAKYPNYVEKLILLNSVGSQGLPTYRDLEPRDVTGRVSTFDELLKVNEVQRIDTIIKEQNKKEMKQIIESGLMAVEDSLISEGLTEEALLCKNYIDITWASNIFNISTDYNGVSFGNGLIHDIKCPTLIIHGALDHISPVKEALEYKEVIGENAKLKIFPHSGHSFKLSDVEDITNLITEFCTKD